LFAGGVGSVCSYDGVIFNTSDPVGGTVSTMAIYNNELYVGGDFSNVGSTQANYLVKYYMISTNMETHNMNQIRFYPNPAIDKITIESDQNNIVEIFNSQGQLVMQQQNTNSIDVASLEAGCYTISIKTEESAKVSQFIKL
jgi:hypothetical protein